jgi:hypothetical protein
VNFFFFDSSTDKYENNVEQIIAQKSVIVCKITYVYINGRPLKVKTFFLQLTQYKIQPMIALHTLYNHN